MKNCANVTNAAACERTPTLEQMLAEMGRLLERPRLVGTLMGFPVYVSCRLPDEVVEIRGNDQTIRFRLDHPYIKGTRLERDLRAI